MGNISQRYCYGDRTLAAVTSSGFVVEPDFRMFGVNLARAFHRQKGVDLFLTTTAIESVGKIAQAFKCDALPQVDYDTILFWALRPYGFSRAVMYKLDLGPTLSFVGSAAGSLLVAGDRVIRRRWPNSGRVSGLNVRAINARDIGEDFDTLWAEKIRERPRLLADRSSTSLRWHFDVPGDKGSARVLCCYRGKELLGYAVVRHAPASKPTGLRRSLIADTFVKLDNPDAVKALWSVAYDEAKRSGSDVLEILGHPGEIRKNCLGWGPYLRRYPACPFYYRADDLELHKDLLKGTAWYASPFDGDTTLWGLGISD